MITHVEDYFGRGCGRCARFDTPDCSARLWHQGIARLRQICLEAGLMETLKWGHPCYTHSGQNIAIIGAFRNNFRLTFFNAALLKDPSDLLEMPGPNSQTKSVVSFSDAADVDRLEACLQAYLREAMSNAAAGLSPEKKTVEIDWPEEFDRGSGRRCNPCQSFPRAYTRSSAQLSDQSEQRKASRNTPHKD